MYGRNRNTVRCAALEPAQHQGLWFGPRRDDSHRPSMESFLNYYFFYYFAEAGLYTLVIGTPTSK